MKNVSTANIRLSTPISNRPYLKHHCAFINIFARALLVSVFALINFSMHVILSLINSRLLPLSDKMDLAEIL